MKKRKTYRKMYSKKIPKIQLIAVALISGMVGTYILLHTFAATPPATYYVSTAGSDTNPGTQAEPFQTISKAASAAMSGSTVLVESGTYHEKVILNKYSNVTYRGIGSTRPIIDGGGTLTDAFYATNAGLHDIVIDNFEMTGQTLSGVNFFGAMNSTLTVKNCVIHGIHSTTLYAYGFRGGEGASGIKILNNQIYDIGPGGESMGIWLWKARDATVSGNTVYLVRKEGIRDGNGLNNTISNNRTFLNWTGIALNGETGATVTNNYSYYNVYGFNPKHTSNPDTAMKFFGLTTPLMTRIWHNTAYNNSAAAISVAMNPPTLDYLDVQDNIFANSGSVHVWDFPGARGTNVAFDGNAYVRSASGRPTNDYFTGWSSPPDNIMTNLTTIRQQLGWEMHGQEDWIPSFNDPVKGDFDYTNIPPIAGVTLGDTLGAQIGARGLSPSPVNYVKYPLTAVAASSHAGSTGTGSASRSVDGASTSYWWTEGDGVGNQWIVYDFGQQRTFQDIIMEVFSQGDNRTPKNFTLQVSNDNQNFNTVYTGINPDSSGSSYKYILSQSATARYLKLNLIDNFGGAYYIIPELSAGLVTSGIPTPPALKGDVTGPGGTPDGKIDLQDISYLIRKYDSTDTAGDITGLNGTPDGKVDIYDMSYAIRNYGG